MAHQLSVALRNARLDAYETVLGTAAKLRFYSGSMPASAAAAATGTLLAEEILDADWMAAATGGTKTMQKGGSAVSSGNPYSIAAVAGGTAGYFRFYDSTGTTCHDQGTLTASGGGGDMTLDNLSIAAGQIVNVTGYVLTDGNA